MKIINSFALLFSLVSVQVSASHNVDIVVAVSNSVYESTEYETIVSHVNEAIEQGNIIFDDYSIEGLLPVTRTLRSIERYNDDLINDIAANQSFADAAFELNKQAYDESSSLFKLMDKYGADQLVYITSSIDEDFDGYVVGDRALIINAPAFMDNHNILLHEFGHLDGLEHNIAEQYGETSSCSLMCSQIERGEFSTVFHPEEIELLNKSIKNEKDSKFSPDVMGHIREEMPILANVSIEGETDLSETDGVATYTVKLLDSDTNEPTFLADDVSLEIYAYAVDQVSSTSLVQVLERVKFLAGENEMTFDLELIDDDVYDSVENGKVGVRFGDKVNADTDIDVAITSDDPEPVTELPVVEEPVKETSGSSGGSLSWALLLSLFLLRSRVKY